MTAVLEMSGLSMTYDTASGELLALDDISFAVQPGEFVSVLGPSGCGKSTLLALASGLVFPTKGEVRVAARRVERPVTDIGIVFQTDVLLDWRRALGNILMQVEMRGMRQRVALCRALIHNPPLLLMDEPFGALDALTREQMVLLLHRIWNETRKSVVFVTHDIQEAVFLADRVLVMTPRPGRIAEEIRVDLRRPRTAATREAPGFLSIVAHIRALFQQTGVLTEEV